MSRSERAGREPRAVSFGMSARLVTPDSPLPDLLDGGERDDESDGNSVIE